MLSNSLKIEHIGYLESSQVVKSKTYVIWVLLSLTAVPVKIELNPEVELPSVSIELKPLKPEDELASVPIELKPEDELSLTVRSDTFLCRPNLCAKSFKLLILLCLSSSEKINKDYFVSICQRFD